MDESFFASLEAELFDRNSGRTGAGARLAVFNYRHRCWEATSIAAATLVDQVLRALESRQRSFEAKDESLTGLERSRGRPSQHRSDRPATMPLNRLIAGSFRSAETDAYCNP